MFKGVMSYMQTYSIYKQNGRQEGEGIQSFLPPCALKQFIKQRLQFSDVCVWGERVLGEMKLKLLQP